MARRRTWWSNAALRSALIEGGGGPRVLDRATLLAVESAWSSTCYLWRTFATTGYKDDEHVIAVPFGNQRRFALFGFRDYATLGVISYGRMGEGIAARFRLHSDGAVTKTGTFSTAGSATESKGASATQSTTAGDTIATSISGTGLGLICPRAGNGGFVTVAIDGDYTAATLLPVVGDTEISAGYFTESERGHRYIECYDSNTDWDRHVALVEGLPNTSHNITVKVQGTKRAASSAVRGYVGGFVAWDGTEVPGVSSAFLFTTTDVSNFSSTGHSALTLASTYNPDGFSNFQLIGENHGSEAQTSGVFAVDGTPVTPTSDQYLSGTEITFSAVNTLTHPSISPTKAADKTVVYTARADQVLQLTAEVEVTWRNAGSLRETYWGMMRHLFTVGYQAFNRMMVGSTSFTKAPSDSTATVGATQDDVLALYDTRHDVVALVHVPDPAETLAGCANSAPLNANFVHTANSNDKGYFTRSTTTNAEAVSVDEVHTGTVGWRVRRIAGLSKA